MKPFPFIVILSILFSISTGSYARESACYGSTTNGKLKRAVKLPLTGENYVASSPAAYALGRTFVHSIVKQIIVDAYKTLEIEYPDKIYKYAEASHKRGGAILPHRSHQNGLSVDFMVPVINPSGQSIPLHTSPFNKFGYNIEFSDEGTYKNLSIDYESMAAHIVTLHEATTALGYDIERIIFDPVLQLGLFKTQYAEYLTEHISFSKKRLWVRHDEHYHVDFLIPCRTLPTEKPSILPKFTRGTQ